MLVLVSHWSRAVIVAALVLTPSVAVADWGSGLWGEMFWGGSEVVPMLPGEGLLLMVFLAGSAGWALFRRERKAAAVFGALALTVPVLAHAKAIQIPHVFVDGTVALADEVNANFLAVSDAFDDFTAQFGRSPASPLGNEPDSLGVCANRTIGETWLFAGNYEPEGTVYAHGQILPINIYDSLFSILGVNYGGDGQTTFGVPDLRGLEPKGVNYVICVFGLFPLQN